MVPRYLVDQNDQPDVPQHVGTTDVDLVLNLELLLDIDAYSRLEQNLQRLGFERGSNDQGNPQHFKWKKRIEGDANVVIDLLCDVDIQGGRVANVPNERRLSAIAIPGAGLALRDFVEISVRAQLLDDRGYAEEIIRVANIAPFIVLKALAYEDRWEPKDAYDLIYCLQFFKSGPIDVAQEFAKLKRQFPEEKLIPQAIEILKNRFTSDKDTRGVDKDGPVSYANFQAAPDQMTSQSSLRDEAAAVVEIFLSELQRLLDEKTS
jgi:hypothetical protein